MNERADYVPCKLLGIELTRKERVSDEIASGMSEARRKTVCQAVAEADVDQWERVEGGKGSSAVFQLYQQANWDSATLCARLREEEVS